VGFKFAIDKLFQYSIIVAHLKKEVIMAKTTTMAQQIRDMAKVILREHGHEMRFHDLFLRIKSKLNAKLRTDYVLASLAAIKGGFELHDNGDSVIVALKGKFTGKLAKPKKKLTVDEFVERAIRKIGKNNSLNTVYSGFNVAFKEYFPGKDPVKEVEKLATKKKILLRPARKNQKGVVISLPKSKSTNPIAEETLKKMGLL
jgi:hypothetical protein